MSSQAVVPSTARATMVRTYGHSAAQFTATQTTNPAAESPDQPRQFVRARPFERRRRRAAIVPPFRVIPMHRSVGRTPAR
ncbi:hypothetical protein [Streptomyces sp. ISL-98]|uniref:hypothetical protein n=1 Tax=Streptomyces sp. ISL-98 TaxID=2819192 RepID=UPI0027E50691|nr:hypothetical protein [Streptomyces sp. ISL-98]